MTGMEAFQGPSGEYRPCKSCGAPVVSPFPDGWHIDLIKEGPRFGPVETFYTPHTDACTQPMPVYAEDTGITMRIAGQYVTRVSVGPPPVPVARTYGPSGYLYTAPTGTLDWSDWIPLGATDDGVQVTGPLHWLDGIWPVHLDGDNPE